jgi:hypothetical protein
MNVTKLVSILVLVSAGSTSAQRMLIEPFMQQRFAYATLQFSSCGVEDCEFDSAQDFTPFDTFVAVLLEACNSEGFARATQFSSISSNGVFGEGTVSGGLGGWEIEACCSVSEDCPWYQGECSKCNQSYFSVDFNVPEQRRYELRAQAGGGGTNPGSVAFRFDGPEGNIRDVCVGGRTGFLENSQGILVPGFYRLLIVTSFDCMDRPRDGVGSSLSSWHLELSVFAETDINGDGVVDLEDHAVLARCLAGPTTEEPPDGCDPGEFERSDLDADGGVDLKDYTILSRFLDG